MSRNSKIALVAAFIILVILIIITLLLTRSSQQKNGLGINPTPIDGFNNGRFKTYKEVNPGYTDDEKRRIEAAKEDLPYRTPNLDIRYSKDVDQFIVARNTDEGNEEFKKWLEENGLSDLYENYPGLFADSDMPIYDYLEFIDKFKKEPQNLPDESRFRSDESKNQIKERETNEKKLNSFRRFANSFTNFDLGGGYINNILQFYSSTPSAEPEENSGGGNEVIDSSVANILPNPLPEISSRAFGAERNYILTACVKNSDVYEEAQQKTGVPWQLLAGIHYREGSCRPDVSLISGRRIGEPEPDNGGQTYTTLLDTAIAAANEFKGKIGGHPPQNFNELIAGAQRYHGTGGRNCGQVGAYKGPCPPPDGIDDPYPLNFFDKEHELMYKVYCADHVLCSPAQLDNRPGVATVIRFLANNQ